MLACLKNLKAPTCFARNIVQTMKSDKNKLKSFICCSSAHLTLGSSSYANGMIKKINYKQFSRPKLLGPYFQVVTSFTKRVQNFERYWHQITSHSWSRSSRNCSWKEQFLEKMLRWRWTHCISFKSSFDNNFFNVQFNITYRIAASNFAESWHRRRGDVVEAEWQKVCELKSYFHDRKTTMFLTIQDMYWYWLAVIIFNILQIRCFSTVIVSTSPSSLHITSINWITINFHFAATFSTPGPAIPREISRLSDLHAPHVASSKWWPIGKKRYRLGNMTNLETC